MIPTNTTTTSATSSPPPAALSTGAPAEQENNADDDEVVQNVDNIDAENSRGFEELLTNFKSFLFHAYNTANSEDLTELKEQSTNIFHADLIKIYTHSPSSGGPTMTTMNHEQVLQENIQRHEMGFRPKVFRYKKIDATSFSTYLRFVNDDSVMICHQVYYISENKVIRIEAQVPETVQKVPGQTSPTSGHNLCGTSNQHQERLLSEQEFCAKVYTPPLEVGDRLLMDNRSGSGMMMRPVLIEYEFIQVFLDIHKPSSGSVFRSYFKAAAATNDVVDDGVIPISDTRGSPYAGGAHLKRRKKRLGKPTRILLRDANENVIAKCSIHRGVLDLGVLDHVAATVYGTRPLCTETESAKVADDAEHDDDDDDDDVDKDADHDVASDDRKPSSSSDQQKDKGDVCYYPWFQVNVMGGSDHSIKGMYFVSVSTESSGQFQPFLKILPVSTTADMSRKTEGASSSLCFAAVDYFQGQLHLGVFQTKPGNQSGGGSTSDNKGGAERNGRIQVDIAPGVDPAMMICLAAVINDMAA